MNFLELKNKVIKEYDRRELKSNCRYKALDEFEQFLEENNVEWLHDVSLFPKEKQDTVESFTQYLKIRKNKKLNAGARSMINELYNQLGFMGN